MKKFLCVLTLLWFVSVVAFAVGRVSGGTNSVTASSTTVAFPTYTPVVGHGIAVITGQHGTNTVSSISTEWGTWIFQKRISITSPNRVEECWVLPSVTSTSSVPTITWSGANRGTCLAFEEYDTAFVASSVLDVSATSTNTGQAGAGTTINSGTTGATTQSSELWLFGTSSDDSAIPNTQTFASPTNSFLVTRNLQFNYTVSATTTEVGIALIDKIVSATQSSVSSAVTSGGYSNYVAMMCCLKFTSAAFVSPFLIFHG